MLGKIVTSCMIGIFACVFVAQYDPWVRETAAFYIYQQMERSSGCVVTGRLTSFRFFSPELVFEDMAIESMEADSWRWQAQRVAISCSWWDFIRRSCLDVQVCLHACHAVTSVENDALAIMPHIKQFFSQSLFPIATSIKLIEFYESSLSLSYEQRRVMALCRFNSMSKKIGSVLKSVVTMTDGFCMMQDQPLVRCMVGTVSATVPIATTEEQKLAGKVELRVELPQLVNPICFVNGTWEEKAGRFSLRNVEQLLTIDPCVIALKDEGLYVDAVARFPLSYAWNLCPHPYAKDTNAVKGNGLLRVRGNVIGKSPLEGQLVIEDVHYYDRLLCAAITLTLQKVNGVAQGAIKAHVRDTELAGSWRLCENSGEAIVSLANGRRCTVPGLPYWYSDPGDLSCSLHKKSDGSWMSSYHCALHSAAYEAPFVTQGTMTSSKGDFALQGLVNDNRYEGVGSLAEFPYVQSLCCYDAHGAPLCVLKGTHGDAHWSGEFSYSFLQALCEAVTDTKLQGKGSVIFDARYDNDKLSMGVHLKEGIIRLPYTYNFIDNLQGHLSWYGKARTLVLKDVQCGLHAGVGRCALGTIQFDTSGMVESAHVPCVFNRCLFNVRKDVFAMVSGHGVLSKAKEEDALMSGHVSVDHAQIKDTLFSLDVSKALLEKGFMATSLHPTVFSALCHATRLAVTLETKDVVRFDTALLQAQAYAYLALAGTVSRPTLEGDIVIDSGFLMLPYKPLYITRGKIHFEPDAFMNPFIELRAKNKIKKHLVTLYAHGLFSDHQIILDASPPLTEEQIIALLLVGSPEESLNAMMPTLIMHNLKMALWGSGSLSFLDNYFKKRTMPFSINLVPSFTDQTGRGGLRGGIEVMVNDKWRALIQKNFSLSEDTRFELEYLFSDDVGVRAVRDERRDIGGEVEMRWKF